MVKRYPVGAAVEVFYNPNNPKYAVLERSGAFKVGLVANLLCFLGAALAAFGHGIRWELSVFEERRSVYEEDGDTRDEPRAKALFVRTLLTTAVLGYSLLACGVLSLITASFMKHGLSLAANHVFDVVGAGFDELVKMLVAFVVSILASAAVSLGISNRVVAVIVGFAIFCLLFLTVDWLL